MGADLIDYTLTWDKKRKLNWNAGFKHIKFLDENSEGFINISNTWGSGDLEETKDTLNSDLTELKDIIRAGGRRDVSLTGIGHLNVLWTGGMSWGEDPTDMLTSLSHLEDGYVLDEVGFCRDEIDYKKILTKILKKKRDLLPLLLNIDKTLDKMLEKEFKK